MKHETQNKEVESDEKNLTFEHFNTTNQENKYTQRHNQCICNNICDSKFSFSFFSIHTNIYGMLSDLLCTLQAKLA